MNCHMNLELKIIREIRIWDLGLGKCKEYNLGTGILNPGRKKRKIMETPIEELEHV